jgi:hypothetical protein
MKLKSGIFAVSVFALACVFAAVPASAESSVIYDNTGPGSLTTNAWSFFGTDTVTDSFTLPGTETIDGANFDAWFFPGDSLTSVDWSITDTPFGSVEASGTSTSGPNTPIATGFGYYSILGESITIPDVTLAGGTYYLELTNGQDAYDTSAWWDESDGPSTAYNANGAIPSETFQILVTPEPPSFVLLGFGMLALAGMAIRSKLMA